MVLWNGREPLVEEVLEAEVVGANQEATSPQVRAPMPDGANEADEVPLVGG